MWILMTNNNVNRENINVSSDNFGRHDLPRSIYKMLVAWDFVPQKIYLEKNFVYLW